MLLITEKIHQKMHAQLDKRTLNMVAAAFLLGTASLSVAATINVTSNADSGAGTLRTAIASAVSGDTINFAPALGTIVLASKLPDIVANLTIDGGTQTVVVDGASSFPILMIDTGTVTLRKLKFQNGKAVGGSGGADGGGGGLGAGGCLFINQATANVTIDTLVFSNCAVQGGNGGSAGTTLVKGGGGGGAWSGVGGATGSSQAAGNGGAGGGPLGGSAGAGNGGIGGFGSGGGGGAYNVGGGGYTGGNGGFGGGGGSGGDGGAFPGGGAGGAGGYGAGGGGGGARFGGSAGAGGAGGGGNAGAGNGAAHGGGGGGAALGPAIFVYQGSLTIINSAAVVSTATAGLGGTGSGMDGAAGTANTASLFAVTPGNVTGSLAAVLPNDAPTASTVAVTGTAQVGTLLTGSYAYADSESDAQGTSTFRWMSDTVVGAGAGKAAIGGATALTYTPVVGDQGRILFFCVTPVASAGTTTGTEVCSSATAAVIAANAAPAASAVTITGAAQVGSALAGSYTYSDADNDVQGISTFKWYADSASNGATKVAITGATNNSYTVANADLAKYLFYCVTPKAQTGVLTGTETCSAATAAVVAAAVPAPAPSNPIPAVIPPNPVTGVGSNLISALNLSSGDGPTLTNCLRDTLRTVIGPNAVFQGQTADGGARIGQPGLQVSFYPLEASYGNGQNSGIYLQSNNPLNVVTSCGTFLTTPAVFNLGEWGAYLNGQGLSLQINAQGVMTVSVGGVVYVARPDYVVTQGTPGAPGLVTGKDGLLRFTDSAGNVQVLYPAFLLPDVLSSQVSQAVIGSTLIQTDGTALVTLLNGQQFVLTPDLTLGGVPPEFATVGWWQDGPNHYRYRTSIFTATSQGFTVKPR